MFENIKNFFAVKPVPKSGSGGGNFPFVQPKAPTKQQSYAGFLKTVKPSTAALGKNDLNLANQDLTSTYRTGATTLKVVQDLTRVSPDLSAALTAYLRVGIPEKYTAWAYNPDGSFNRDATLLANQVLTRFDSLPDYTTGFAQTSTIRSLSESLARELVQGGACSLELVLDKSRLPLKFQPIPINSLEWYQDGAGLRPAQIVSGTRIDLDQPTFIYTSLDQPLDSAYPISPLESAIQPVLASMTFLNDLRRVCARHIHPRYDVNIDEDKLRARITPDIASDSDKLSEYMNNILAEVESVINNLGVEEALVHFDFLSIGFISGADGDVPNTFTTVKDIYNSKISTGSKVMPSILGHSSASQNIASTETMLFMLSANGTIRLKLQEVYSKAMTLAVRLFGMDVTVQFKFDSIDLRPDSELEAFRAMKQSRILEQLSLGFITDDEACLALTGGLTPAGYTPKTGTMFKTGAGAASNGNPTSGTSTGGDGKALDQSLKSDQPKQPKGPAKKE
jgi:hypothetical protein